MSSPPPISAAAAARLLESIAAPEGEELVPGYAVQRRLGDGGGGTVYLAVRRGSEHPVALKILARPMRDDAARRAWRELEILSQVRLPCVPRVLDYGIHAARLYIATEWIDGRPLDQAAAGLPLRPRVDLLARVADAAQSLHERGVIHRDLKPSNILVDASGQPAIIDLGIASLVAEGVMETLTADGAPVGTPAFMAPEQARGDRAAVSTRSDVYGLGATAYLVLTGHTPHDADTTLHEAIRRVAEDPARDPRDLDPALPRPLAAVLRKAVERDPARRYATAAEFGEDLRRWLAGEPVRAHPASPWVRAMRWAGRHPRTVTSAAWASVMALAFAGLLAGRWWYHNATASHGYITPRAPWEVQVLASSGRVVAAWPSSERMNGAFGGAMAERVSRPTKSDVFVTLADTSVGRPWDGILCVWKAPDFKNPLWTAPGDDPLVVPQLPELLGHDRSISPMGNGDFRARHALIDDIFPAEPGQEIAVALTSTQHPAAIRIYALDGRVLYECWHMGTLGSMVWLAGPRLLVVTGCHGRTDWGAQGYTEISPDDRWPSAVFAIRPRAGARVRDGWLCDAEHRDLGIELAWYLFLNGEPTLPTKVALFHATRAHTRNPGENLFDLHVGLEREGGIRWTLDSAGMVVATEISDGGKRWARELEGLRLEPRLERAEEPGSLWP